MDLDSILQGYQAFQQTHPIIGSMAQASIVFPLSDAIAQGISNRKLDWRKLLYTTALSPLYGLSLYGLVQTGEGIGAGLRAGGLDEQLGVTGTALVQSALGPNLLGNVHNAFFFYNNAAGERTGYRLGGLRDAYHSLARTVRDSGVRAAWQEFKEAIPGDEYRKSVIGTLTAWNAITTANYVLVPEPLRTPFALLCIVPWVTALSLWSIVGAKRCTTPSAS